MPDLKFGEWLPDLPENENPGAILAKNCIPAAVSYRGFKSLSPFSNALAQPANSSFWSRHGGTIYNFAGTANNLYHLTNATTWSNANKAGSAYSSQNWDFVAFGDRVIAVDGATTPQYFTMGQSSNFADLGGNPPIARVVGIIRDFVILGDITGSPDVSEDGVQWSAFNNSDLWAPSLMTQAGFAPLRGGGKVQRIVDGDMGYIFQESSIRAIEYVGPPTIFQLDRIITEHGTPAPRSVTWTKDLVFYYSSDGFFKLNRSSRELTPIGSQRVNNWFRDQVAPSEIVNMVGTVDRSRQLVFWSFKTSSSDTQNTRVLVYHWLVDRWSYLEIGTQHIGEFASNSASLDELDAILGGNIDSASINVDSDSFAGGALSFLGFDTDNKAGSFNGTALVAEIDTPEFNQQHAMTWVDNVTPIVSGTNANVEVASVSRDRINDEPAIGPYVNINSIGEANVRANARFHRFRTRITGDFTHAQRVEFIAKRKGRR